MIPPYGAAASPWLCALFYRRIHDHIEAAGAEPDLVGSAAASPVFAEVPQKAPANRHGVCGKSGWAAQKFMGRRRHAGRRCRLPDAEKGGSAIDAAIATQLGAHPGRTAVVGYRGRAFLLYSTAKGVQAFDGRETAPAAADEHLFGTGVHRRRQAPFRVRRRPARPWRSNTAGKHRPPMPDDCGSTRVSTSCCVAMAASMALPPFFSIW